jgi:membrane-associated protease RseP (regulator of RpoE activity)
MKKPDRKISKLIALSLVALSIIMFYFLYYASNINIIVRWVFALVILAIVGVTITALLDLRKVFYGFYIMGGKNGISTITEISKRYKVFWEILAVWGLTLGFGLATYPLMRGKIDKRVYAAGIISLILILVFVVPYFSSAFSFINLPQLQNAIAARQQSPQNNILYYASTAITIIFGFTGTIILSLLSNAASIIYSIANYLSNISLGVAASGAASQIPGVAPVIPGIDLPLFAGLISLIIILIVHEFSHGIVAKGYKIKLKEIGLLVFGFIPMGAYVEPDEKNLGKLDKIKQTKIFAAGIGSNFALMIIFFLLMMALVVFVIPSAYQYKVTITGTAPNYPANGILQNGMQILYWNNQSTSNITSFENIASQTKPNSTVSVFTNTGLYKFKAVQDPSNSSRGLIGISIAYEPIIQTPYAKVVYFLYTLFALSMLLNFLVGVVNLLPIPGFDGWRIYKANIKSEKIINFFGALVIIIIIINVLPWIFYL